MLYLGIDQHRKQLTVNLRNESGDVVLRRQVSTRWADVRAFFSGLADQSEAEGGYVAILEVCGFNHWLLALLEEQRCRRVVLVQAEKRSPRKTDRRDANRLSELLWVNRERLLAGKKVHELRVVQPANPRDEQARQTTALWNRITRQRTRTINAIQHVLLKHNLQQACPCKSLDTKRARAWLRSLGLPPIDRLELTFLLDQWELWDQQREALKSQIEAQQQAHPEAMLLATLPGAGAFTSLCLASRVGDIKRFAGPQSLANYWGLTPRCGNSGDARQRLGSITKQGSPLARFVLGQLVLHVLRRDGAMRRWYLAIKRRRGAKIARVAVMRRLATVIWHMLKHDQPYQLGPPPRSRRDKEHDAMRVPCKTSARTRQKGAAPAASIAAPT
jgi:transposase